MGKITHMNTKQEKGVYFYTTIGLAAVLAIVLIWWGVSSYNASQDARLIGAAQEGFSIGIQQTLQDLFDIATTCQPLPLTSAEANMTISLIAVECLQLPEGAQ